jgi:hypothetical protein
MTTNDYDRYDTDEDRLSRAQQLAGYDPRAAATELRAIAREPWGR